MIPARRGDSRPCVFVHARVPRPAPFRWTCIHIRYIRCMLVAGVSEVVLGWVAVTEVGATPPVGPCGALQASCSAS